PDIVEAVEENEPPSPAQEFVVNALEHVTLGNFRYAILEAVIALEIVLARYLRLALERRDLPKEAIDDFLSPQLALRDRVSVLLNLTLGRDALQDYDFGKILTVIRWRNHIVHRHGHLPVGLQAKDIFEGTRALLGLVLFIDSKYAELLAEP